jgi:hypothetical protein
MIGCPDQRLIGFGEGAFQGLDGGGGGPSSRSRFGKPRNILAQPPYQVCVFVLPAWISHGNALWGGL